jgi:hypothetical protein
MLVLRRSDASVVLLTFALQFSATLRLRDCKRVTRRTASRQTPACLRARLFPRRCGSSGIALPASAGTYKLFVVDAQGNKVGESAAQLRVK